MRDSTFLGLRDRVIGQAGASQERRAGFKMQRHAAFQEDRARQIRAGREIDRSPAGVAAAVDRLLNRLGAERLAVGRGAQVADVHDGSAAVKAAAVSSQSERTQNNKASASYFLLLGKLVDTR